MIGEISEGGGDALDTIRAVPGCREVTVAAANSTEQSPLEGTALIPAGVAAEMKVDLRSAEKRHPNDPVFQRKSVREILPDA